MSRVWGGTAFAKRSAAMKAPVGLLSGSAVCDSRWRGVAPTSATPTRSLGKLARVWEVKSRMDRTFSRIENLWPRDGSCPLPLRSKRIFNKCFRIVKTQKISSGALLIWWGHRSHRTQFLPLFCSGVDEKSVSRPVGSWNFQGAIFPEKEKYRPRSAAMILSGESAAKWIGCVAGR